MEETEFEHIAQEMRPRLTAHCQRYLSAGTLAEEADDIVQETLVHERLSEYQSIEALGMTIARNLCIDHLRRNKAQTASLEQMKHPAEICTATERTDQAIIGEDTQRRLNRAMDRLPDTQRRMLLLRSEGKSLDEIAEICGANKTSTKTMISAARRSLLKMMKS
ncbi:RNA polymerase sigma factor [Prevotella copri]|uniref:RNA polymerase sigma factor n=1 Tax=Segatella copri TaxID=165179 RepID=A0AA90ZKE3_9BACT|nr:RNA polymerase sigma factor [Segatella copri]MQN12797.1 RNA polymerase sigma factor [Segatella copri]